MRTGRSFLALCVLATFGVARADTLIIQGIDQAQQTAAQRPARGMTMSKVTSNWGAPFTKNAAVGEPPITRWEYNDFVVFFEHDRVLHAVLKHP
jgi:hypothetical protein